MSEVTFAKAFLTQLDRKPIRFPADYVSDPRTYPSQTPVSIMTSTMLLLIADLQLTYNPVHLAKAVTPFPQAHNPRNNNNDDASLSADSQHNAQADSGWHERASDTLWVSTCRD